MFKQTQPAQSHWPEYFMEAAGLGIFMMSAGLFATLLEDPGSPVHLALDSPLARRALMGLAMGLTAVALIYSPWGKRSGAHFNPAVTLTFWGLGKVAPRDAAFYVLAQLLGGLGGVLLVFLLLGSHFARPPVSFVVTVPGIAGSGVAFAAETLIAFGLMLMVLVTTNRPRLTRYTGLFAGALLAFYITIEAPFSGTGLNPARSLASALPARNMTGLWIYLIAPLLGMGLAALLYRRRSGWREVACAKLNHASNHRCIFRNCHYHEMMAANPEKTNPQSKGVTHGKPKI